MNTVSLFTTLANKIKDKFEFIDVQILDRQDKRVSICWNKDSPQYQQVYKILTEMA